MFCNIPETLCVWLRVEKKTTLDNYIHGPRTPKQLQQLNVENSLKQAEEGN